MSRSAPTKVVPDTIAITPHIHLQPRYCVMYALINGPRNAPEEMERLKNIKAWPLSWKKNKSATTLETGASAAAVTKPPTMREARRLPYVVEKKPHMLTKERANSDRR